MSCCIALEACVSIRHVHNDIHLLTAQAHRPLVARDPELRICRETISDTSPRRRFEPYRFLSWLMHFVTTASIHSSSLPPVAPSPLLVLVGGWKATFRPSCKGSCFANASRRALGSREKGIGCWGPTEPRGGTVMDIDRDGVAAAGVGAGATEGEFPLGRLRFSA